MKKILLLFCLVLIIRMSEAQVLLPNFWVPNHSTNDIRSDKDYIYLMGSSQIGPYTGSVALLHAGSFVPDKTFPVIGFWGNAYATLTRIGDIISDGNNGFYITGYNMSFRGIECKGLVYHLLSDYSMDTNFSTASYNQVSGDKAVLIGDYIYVGINNVNSALWDVGRIPNQGIVKMNKKTGQIDTTFSPIVINKDGSSAYISDMVYDGSFLYILGSFTFKGETTKKTIARINLNTGLQDASFVFPTYTGDIIKFFVDENHVYVLFYNVNSYNFGGNSTQQLYRVNKNTGVIDASFDLKQITDKTLQDFTIYGNDLYVEGRFTSIGGGNVKLFAKLDKTTGIADNGFDAGFTSTPAGTGNIGWVNATDIYITGNGSYNYPYQDFGNNIAGHSWRGIVKLNRQTGQFDVNFKAFGSGDIEKIIFIGTDLFCIQSGGLSCGGILNRGIAKVSKLTGEAVPYPTNNAISMIVDDQYTYYVESGKFNLLRINNTTHLIETLIVSGVENIIGIDGDNLLVAIGINGKLNIKKVNKNTGVIDPVFNFNNSTYAKYQSIVVSPNCYYMAGSFTTADGIKDLCKLDKTTGAIDKTFDMKISSLGNISLLLDGGYLYLNDIRFNADYKFDYLARIDLNVNKIDPNYFFFDPITNRTSMVSENSLVADSKYIYVRGVRVNKLTGIVDTSFNGGEPFFGGPTLLENNILYTVGKGYGAYGGYGLGFGLDGRTNFSVYDVSKSNSYSIKLVSPVSGAQFTQGDNVNIKTEIVMTYPFLAQKVEIFDNNNLITTFNSFQSAYTWSTNLASAGNHTIKAIVYSNNGQVRQTTTNITIAANPNLPYLEITSPVALQEYSPDFNINMIVKATAPSPKTVKKVDFYVDNSLVKSFTGSPFSYEWDTYYEKAGVHTFVAIMTLSDNTTYTQSANFTLLSYLNTLSVFMGDTVNTLITSDVFSKLSTSKTYTYTCTLTDGSALPAWLHFDGTKLTLIGIVPNNNPSQILHLVITATATDKTLSANDYVNVFIVGTGIEESQLGNSFKVYPNPTTGSIIIDLQTDFHKSTIQIYDLQGKLTQTITNPTEKTTVFLKNKGMYVAKVITPKGMMYKKVIVE